MLKLEIASLKFQNALNKAFPNSKKEYFSSAIITAAGSGTRMGGVSKQLLDLCGKPCLAYSLLAFQNCIDISEIIIVARESEKEIIQKICTNYGITKLKAIVFGGETRQASVSNGFSAINISSDFVLIHDAARPLILPESITKLLKDARRYGAATAAKKISDTIKRSLDGKFISETVPREDLFSVQTPQVFKTDLYRVALALAEKDQITVTDDCSLAEHAGFSVKLCDLGIQNLKLTTSEDLNLVKSILMERENG